MIGENECVVNIGTAARPRLLPHLLAGRGVVGGDDAGHADRVEPSVREHRCGLRPRAVRRRGAHHRERRRRGRSPTAPCRCRRRSPSSLRARPCARTDRCGCPPRAASRSRGRLRASTSALSCAGQACGVRGRRAQRHRDWVRATASSRTLAAAQQEVRRITKAREQSRRGSDAISHRAHVTTTLHRATSRAHRSWRARSGFGR